MRRETDLLGEAHIPESVVYGIQTHRARTNFPRRRQGCVGDYHSLVTALLWVKKAAALANERCGFLKGIQRRAIFAAADQVFALDSDWSEIFPVHRLHGGGGTSANLNVNEVLARIGGQWLEAEGCRDPLSPGGHVNLHQSTNDVYPTACRIAVGLEWPSLEDSLRGLEAVFGRIGERYRGVKRLARTCLQDAVPVPCDGFISGYAAFVARLRRRLAEAAASLQSVNLGGTIIGDSSAVPACYLDAVVPALREVSGLDAYAQSGNLFDAAQNPDDLQAISACLDTLARGLIKIAKDLRLLASGPDAGLNEVTLPAVQPGSSAMPGKVNPVIPEFLIQSCMEVCGRCHAVSMALDHGELDLNVWESVMVFNTLDAFDLMEQAIRSLIENCLEGIEFNVRTLAEHCGCSIAVIERLSRSHGYEMISELCRKARADGEDVLGIFRQKGLL